MGRTLKAAPRSDASLHRSRGAQLLEGALFDLADAPAADAQALSELVVAGAVPLADAPVGHQHIAFARIEQRHELAQLVAGEDALRGAGWVGHGSEDLIVSRP